MRKLFLVILIALSGTINAFAGDQNSAQQSVIDSLSFELKSLRHDYEFLYCESSLNDLKHDLDVFKNNLDSNSNSMVINMYHSRFNSDLYYSYKENYRSSVGYFDSLKESVNQLKYLIYLKMENSNYGFSETEINVLESKIDVIDKGVKSVEASLNYQKVVLDAYMR